MRRGEGGIARTRRGAVKLRLLPPETVPMTKEQHEQAVSALAAMIVDWLRRQNASEQTTTNGHQLRADPDEPQAGQP